MKRDLLQVAVVTVFLISMTTRSFAETGEDAWLRYAPLEHQTAQHFFVSSIDCGRAWKFHRFEIGPAGVDSWDERYARAA